MTDKQVELISKAKAILKILNSLNVSDRQAVVEISGRLMEAEDRGRMSAEQEAMEAEKLEYMNSAKASSPGALIGMPPIPTGGLFRG